MTPSHLAPTSTEKKLGRTSEAVLTGHVIAPKLGNATAKYVHRHLCADMIYRTGGRLTSKRRAELGRAAWKVLHTTFARFPESPTEEEQEALRSYVHLFQRLYPWYVLHHVAHTKVMRKTNRDCSGECAEHFGQVLAKYPPQVSSRTAAAMWGCYVHNIVNKRLKKPEFNCADIGDAYDCGVSNTLIRTTCETWTDCVHQHLVWRRGADSIEQRHSCMRPGPQSARE